MEGGMCGEREDPLTLRAAGCRGDSVLPLQVLSLQEDMACELLFILEGSLCCTMFQSDTDK